MKHHFLFFRIQYFSPFSVDHLSFQYFLFIKNNMFIFTRNILLALVHLFAFYFYNTDNFQAAEFINIKLSPHFEVL